eukprot:CAMPEP_0170556808 /NCGR_PEP_ID=MMETSP0211-20121228/18778_1 /TAXON_ID=311385 /ORGANISM="Pseudokeronopsis sp., Strain OXSARD2" /LENGTH=36 /DNA_ID= /DNA_START= /DNA_END= /DNA_ORIENTATION=
MELLGLLVPHPDEEPADHGLDLDDLLDVQIEVVVVP